MSTSRITIPRPKYPKRGAFFANRYVRILTKSAAANELGGDICWMLTVIAHQEDSKRYAGAVTYFNNQLAPLCGFNSVNRLDRARRKAIESGWLHYEQGLKRNPGRYWVMVPSSAQHLIDGPCDEGFPSILPLQNGEESHGQNGFLSILEVQSEKQPGGNREESVDPSNLYLRPIPEDKENPLPPKGGLEQTQTPEKTSRKSRASKPAFDPSTVPLPPALDTPAFHEAWEAWLRHRAELPGSKGKLTHTAVESQLKRLEKLGLQPAIDAIELSTANGWVGIHQDTKGTANGRQNQRVGPGQKHDPHAAEKDPRHGTW